jgi:anti-anti-sigma factor
MSELVVEEQFSSQQAVTLAVKGMLTVLNAQQMQQLFSPYSKGEKNLVLSADAVEDIDTSGLQLLIGLSKELAQKNKMLQIRDLNNQLSEDLTILGLGDLLA